MRPPGLLAFAGCFVLAAANNITFCLGNNPKVPADIANFTRCDCADGYRGSHCQVNDGMSAVVVTAACISLISCVIQFYFRCKFPRMFSQWPNYIIYWRSVFDFVFSLHLVVMNLWLLADAEIVRCSLKPDDWEFPAALPSDLTDGCGAGERVFCQYFAFMTQGTLVGSLMWFAFGSLDYWRTISQPFVHPSTMKRNYTFWTFLIAITTGVFTILDVYGENFNTLLYRSNIQVCWTGQTGKVNPINILCTYIWLLAALGMSSYIGSVGYIKMRSGGTMDTLQKRMKAIENSRAQLLAFIVFWGYVAVIFGLLYTFETPWKSSTWGPYFLAIVLPLNGFINTIVWARNNREDIVKACRGNRGKQDAFERSHKLLAAMERQEEETNDMSSSLKAELLAKIAAGMRQVLLNTDAQTPDMNAQKDVGGQSISKLIRDPTKFRKRVLNQGRESRIPKFLRCPAIDAARDVEFIAHRPNAFQYLRESVYGVSDEQYLSSFESLSSEALSGGKSGAFFFTTPDKKLVVKTLEPGTLFKSSELGVLLEIIDHYCHHMTPRSARRQSRQKGASPLGCCSLITKIFGCYTIKIYGQTIEFYVMEKLDPESADLKVTERYDLKGSWVDRLSKKGSGTRKDQNFEGQTINLELRQAQEIFMQSVSDVHFFERNNIMDYSLLLAVHRCRDARVKDKHCTFHRDGKQTPAGQPEPVEEKEAKEGKGELTVHITEQEKIKPLASPGVVAGATDPKTGHLELDEFVRTPSRTVPVHKTFRGGMQSAFMEGPGIYFLGIIDPLQKWDFSKIVEGFFKRYIMLKGLGISAVPPSTFATRFLMMMLKNLAVSLSSLQSLGPEHRAEYGIHGVRLVNHRTGKDGKFEYLVQLMRLEEETEYDRKGSGSTSRMSIDMARLMNVTENSLIACECWETEDKVTESEQGRDLAENYRRQRGLGEIGARHEPERKMNFLETIGGALAAPVVAIGEITGISRLTTSVRTSTLAEDEAERGRSPIAPKRTLSNLPSPLGSPPATRSGNNSVSSPQGSYEPPSVQQGTESVSAALGTHEPPRSPAFSLSSN